MGGGDRPGADPRRVMTRARAGALAVLLALVLLCAGCASGTRNGGGTSATAGSRPPGREGLMLLAASGTGAVALDRGTATFIGVDRSGERVWTDPHGPTYGADVRCVDRCPAAVVSGSADLRGPSPAPRLFTASSATAFPVPAAHRRQVLTARSPADAVVEEGDAAGRTWLRVLRSGSDERIPVEAPAQVWAESPDGTVALSFARVVGIAGARLRWFARDRGGWRLADDRAPRGDVWDACVADGGQVALLTGRAPALLLGRRERVPLRVDLEAAGECAVGRRGGAVVQRSKDSRGVIRTAIRWVDLDGTQVWARDYSSEAFVAVDPAGTHAAVAHDGTLEVLDAGGKVVRTRPGVQAVRFTADGQLVIVTADGRVEWLPPPPPAPRATAGA